VERLDRLDYQRLREALRAPQVATAPEKDPQPLELLDRIELPVGDQVRSIELRCGDLTRVTQDDAVDVLVVSAFPDAYALLPIDGSLIGGLALQGLFVGELALDKAVDLRDTCSCWMSRELDPGDSGLPFRRILCFEPHRRGRPPEVVGDIFRALIPFLDGKDLKTVAMPLVSTGVAETPVAEILPPLLEAAIHWITLGIPLERLTIVVFADHQKAEARATFTREKSKCQRDTVATQSGFDFDVFVSYAHENERDTDLIVEELVRAKPDVKIFFDRFELDVGSSWQGDLFEALDASRRILVLYSPAYLQSKVCKEEFNIAWARSRESDQSILFPLYLYTASLPTYMKVVQYIDCREGDPEKVAAACQTLVGTLETT
jgi:hypothetical protein